MMGKSQASLLFLEVTGYPKQRSDHEYEVFFDEVLPGVWGKLTAYAPVNASLWGDAVAAAFETHASAARCALDLRDYFRQTNWRRSGLTQPLSSRIALHSGSVFRGPHPVVAQEVLVGPVVEFAARLREVTPPGEVWASNAYASQLQTELSDDHDDTIRVVPLGNPEGAKRLVTDALFQVRRSGDSGVVSEQVNSYLEVINKELRLVASELGCSSSSIRLLDPASDNRYTYFLSAFGPGSELIKDERIPADKGIAASVLKLRRPRVSNDLLGDHTFDPRTAKKAEIVPRNMITVPVFDQDDVIGVAQFINKPIGAFTQEDVRRALDFTRAHGPMIADYRSRHASAGKSTDHYEGLRECTVLFTDFTSYGDFLDQLARRQELDILPVMLNEYLELVGRAAREHNCWVDKFMGDGVMLLANAPQESADFGAAAVRLALELTHGTRALLGQWRNYAVPVDGVRSRIGIATGQVYLKNLGTSGPRSYTALGPAVNRAWKLLGVGSREADSITLDARTYDLAREAVTELGSAREVQLSAKDASGVELLAHELILPAT